jgi:uncharacterized protein with HEPN domain
MQLEFKVWAYNILTAINEIETFLVGINDFSAYQADLKTKWAIERNLEIIGEAMKRMLNLNPDLNFTDARKIVDTRNRIIHGYNTVSDEVLWTIVTSNLQTLKLQVEEILK